MSRRRQCLLTVLGLLFLDLVTPFIPIFGILCLYLIWQRPPWFRAMVDQLYD